MGNENVAIIKTEKKPANNSLLIYSFSTNDRIVKWNGSAPDSTDKPPYKIMHGKTERKIKIYVGA